MGIRREDALTPRLGPRTNDSRRRSSRRDSKTKSERSLPPSLSVVVRRASLASRAGSCTQHGTLAAASAEWSASASALRRRRR